MNLSFEQPLWLLALVPAAAAVVLGVYFSEKRHAALSYPDLKGLPGETGPERVWVRWTPTLLAGLVLVLAVTAMARPQSITREAAGPAQGIDILLVLDTSISMRALDFKPVDRMTAAKNAARDFIKRRVSDRIGILVFGGAPLLTCPLTLDYDALLEFLDAVEPDMTHVDGTAIGDAIASAVNHLKGSRAKSRVIILLTDGSSNVDVIDPVTAAKTAKTFGIKIYTIGTGKRGQALIPIDHPVFGRQMARISDSLDEDTLLKVAAETDGKYFRATNRNELSKIYEEIDHLEKTQYDRPETVTRADLHGWLLVPAVLLVGLEMLLSGTLLMRIP